MSEQYSAERRRLPGYEAGGLPGFEAAARRRDDGVRSARRATNLTAAVLIAGVAVTTGYFAHAAATGTALTGSGGTVQQGQAGTVSGHGTHLTHPVVTSGGSGVAVGGSGGGGGAGGSAAGWRDS
jgi:hypothetical protein